MDETQGPKPEPEPFFTTAIRDDGPIVELHIPLSVLGIDKPDFDWAVFAFEKEGTLELRQFLDEHLEKVALWERANGN